MATGVGRLKADQASDPSLPERRRDWIVAAATGAGGWQFQNRKSPDASRLSTTRGGHSRRNANREKYDAVAHALGLHGAPSMPTRIRQPELRRAEWTPESCDCRLPLLEISGTEIPERGVPRRRLYHISMQRNRAAAGHERTHRAGTNSPRCSQCSRGTFLCGVLPVQSNSRLSVLSNHAEPRARHLAVITCMREAS